ncbi:hypothetical protein V8C86DRAFT_718119 [Haematococcus lacustris]
MGADPTPAPPPGAAAASAAAAAGGRGGGPEPPATPPQPGVVGGDVGAPLPSWLRGAGERGGTGRSQEGVVVGLPRSVSRSFGGVTPAEPLSAGGSWSAAELLRLIQADVERGDSGCEAGCGAARAGGSGSSSASSSSGATRGWGEVKQEQVGGVCDRGSCVCGGGEAARAHPSSHVRALACWEDVERVYCLAHKYCMQSVMEVCRRRLMLAVQATREARDELMWLPEMGRTAVNMQSSYQRRLARAAEGLALDDPTSPSYICRWLAFAVQYHEPELERAMQRLVQDNLSAVLYAVSRSTAANAAFLRHWCALGPAYSLRLLTPVAAKPGALPAQLDAMDTDDSAASDTIAWRRTRSGNVSLSGGGMGPQGLPPLGLIMGG